MHTEVTGKHVVVSLCMFGIMAAFALMILEVSIDGPPAEVQATAPEKATDAARSEGSDRPGSAEAPSTAPPAPVPPMHTPSDVLIEDDTKLALTDSLPIAPSPMETPDARWDDTPGADSSRTPIASSTDSLRSAPNDSVRTRRVAERIAAIVSRAVSDPEASSAPSTNELPAARREPPRPSAFASAVAGTIPEDAADGPGITGLVTDETRTRVGRDFYDAFYDRWEAPDKDFYYTVVVSEQPMPSLGTRVVVRLNQNTVFQARLQPRSELIEQAARRAVVLTQRRLQSNPTMNVY